MKAVDHLASAFLRRILRRMKELGLNNTALAKRMHVSRPYITKVLSGDVNFSFTTAAKLARALQMDFVPGLVPHETPIPPTKPADIGNPTWGLSPLAMGSVPNLESVGDKMR